VSLIDSNSAICKHKKARHWRASSQGSSILLIV
jgi:hypothetical protein